jgi:hypothetical protein
VLAFVSDGYRCMHADFARYLLSRVFWPKDSQHTFSYDWRVFPRRVMADGSAKRAMVLALSRLPKLTDRTVEQLNGGGFSRHHIRRSQLELGSNVLRPLQLQLNNGGVACSIVCANPLLLMQWFAEECPAYKMLLERSEAGDAPPLQPVLSFADFGPEALLREEVWLTIAVFPTVMLKDIKSGAARSLLRHMFLDGSLLSTLRTATGKASQTWSALLATLGTATQARSLLATLRTAMTKANMRQPRPRRQPLIHVSESYDTLQAQLVRTDVGSSSCQVLSWKTLSCGTSSSICGVNPPTLKLFMTNRQGKSSWMPSQWKSRTWYYNCCKDCHPEAFLPEYDGARRVLQVAVD